MRNRYAFTHREKNRHLAISSLLSVLLLLLVSVGCYPYTRFFYYTPVYSSMNLRLSADEITLKKGESYQLRCICIHQTISYSSTNFRIASVSPGGKIYALQKGTTVINVTDGTHSTGCKVHVI